MMHVPRNVCRALLIALLIGGVSCARTVQKSSSSIEPPGPRPNVLLITVDDMNWDSLGVTGNPIPGISPNVDRLARDGMLFERAHVTVAICHPTRAVWMTGRYPQNNGALGFEAIDAGVPTLVEALADAGYYTGLMAKTGHVVPSRAAAWDELVPARELKNGRSPQLYYQHAARFFENAKAAGQSFFLMANAQDPHRPFAGSRQEVEFKARDARRRGPQYGGGFPAAEGAYAPSEVPIPGFLPDLPPIRRELAEYYTSVHRADETTGALLRALDAAGFTDSTLVMWLSDHGMALPFAKTNVWRNSTRTSWIVRWPGVVSAGSRDARHFVSGIDLAPTILDAVEVPNLAGTDGRSFLPLLRGESQAGREHVFTQIDELSSRRAYPMRAVTDGRFGYIFNAWADGQTEFRNESMSGLTFAAMQEAARTDAAIAARVRHFVYRTPEELYDYRRDPDGLHNLIDDPRYEETAARYRALLLDHMKASNDPQRAAFERFLAGETLQTSDAAPPQ